MQEEQEVGAVDSPQRPERSYSFTQQVKPVLGSSPSSSSSSSCSSPVTAPPPRPVAVAAPASWLVGETEAVCAVVAPPLYSYDPNGSDLPRDCRVLQYYYNLGVQWYHQSLWQQQSYSVPEQTYYTPQTYLPPPEPPHGESPQSPPTVSPPRAPPTVSPPRAPPR
ncbi:unnamed protein product [Knipowitschia caucasica]